MVLKEGKPEGATADRVSCAHKHAGSQLWSRRRVWDKRARRKKKGDPCLLEAWVSGKTTRAIEVARVFVSMTSIALSVQPPARKAERFLKVTGFSAAAVVGNSDAFAAAVITARFTAQKSAPAQLAGTPPARQGAATSALFMELSSTPHASGDIETACANATKK